MLAPEQIISSLFIFPDVSADKMEPEGIAIAVIAMGAKVAIQPAALVTSTDTEALITIAVVVNILEPPTCIVLPFILKA